MPRLDLRKALGDVYVATSDPRLVEIPELRFVMVDGHGDPNGSPWYEESVEALFAVSDAVRAAARSRNPEMDFAPMPLEGRWWVEGDRDFSYDDRSSWNWTLMVAQPPTVTSDVVERAIAETGRRHLLGAVDRIRYEITREGLVAQVLHEGAYVREPETIEKLHAFVAEQGYEPRGYHHEIYLCDERTVDPADLRTIVRQPVAELHRR
jgi:hypothetical protein